MGNISILNAIINYFDVIYSTQNRSVTLQVSFDKFKINILIKGRKRKKCHVIVHCYCENII